MDLSLRSVLTAGAGVATATAIVMAPSVIPPTITSAAPAHARIVTPTELAANVTPITQELLQSVVAAINTVAPGLGVPAAPALAAAPEPLNATSDVINSVYSFTRYWANYATLDLTPWVLQFIPFGWVVTDQINIWYQPFVLRTTDAFVYDFLDPIVNNPLNLNVWINSGIALANAAISGLINGVIGEINYLFGWILPPLPPLPNVAAEDLTTQTLATSADVTAVPALARAALAPPDETGLVAADTVDAEAEPNEGAAAEAQTADTAAADVSAPAADVTTPVATTEPTIDPEATDADGVPAAAQADTTPADAGTTPADTTPASDTPADTTPAPAADTTKAGDTTKTDAGATTDQDPDKTDNAKPDSPAKPAKPAKADKSDSGKPVKRTKDTPRAGEKAASDTAQARDNANQKADSGPGDHRKDHQKDDSGN